MDTQDKAPMSLETLDPPHRMAPKPTVTQNQRNDITTCLAITANTLEILASSWKSPFLETISNTTQSLLKNMQACNLRICHNHESQST
jgi:hypothetical protein